MKHRAALIDLHYLPSIEYLCVLSDWEQIILEKHENFVKQSYRNRCFINTTQGIEMLTVPLTGKHGKVSIAEVHIDHSKKWQNNHWRTIESAYRKAPFYEHYAGDLKKIIYEPFPFLFDLNLHLLSFCLKSLRCEKELSTTLSYEKQALPSVTDLRSVVNSKKTYRERNFYKPLPYYQVFGNTFVSNLSIVDLLMCTGPEAGQIIRASQQAGARLPKLS